MKERYAFISYAHADYKLIRDDILSIAREHAIWLDKAKLIAGDRFDNEIEQSIEGSSAFILFLTMNYGDSTYCLKEIRMAKKRSPFRSFQLSDLSARGASRKPFFFRRPFSCSCRLPCRFPPARYSATPLRTVDLNMRYLLATYVIPPLPSSCASCPAISLLSFSEWFLNIS